MSVVIGLVALLAPRPNNDNFTVPTTLPPPVSTTLGPPPTFCTECTTLVPTIPPPTTPPSTVPAPTFYPVNVGGHLAFMETASGQLVPVPQSNRDNGPIYVALIGGFFLLISTVVTALFARAAAAREQRTSSTGLMKGPP
jgi:hypothetical protein